MSYRYLLAPLFSALVCASACSDEATDTDTGTNPMDSGVVADSGTPDSGVPADSGPPRDLGFDDTGNPIDGGVEDTGVPADTGVGGDTGVNPDGGPGPTCDPNFGAAQACGGNPVGNWTYRGACTSVNILMGLANFCGGMVQIQNQSETASGTLELTGTATAGDYLRDGTSLVQVALTVPTSCVPNCNLFELTLEGGMGITATCQTSGSVCDCRVERTVRVMDQGTYVVSGNVLTAFGSGGTTFDYDYCVSGNNLVYKGQASNATDKEMVFVLDR